MPAVYAVARTECVGGRSSLPEGGRGRFCRAQTTKTLGFATSRGGVRPGGTDSIKDQQDGERPPESNPTHARRRPPRSAPRRARPSAADPKFLANLYRERGYGQGDVNKQPAPPAALRPGLDAPAS